MKAYISYLIDSLKIRKSPNRLKKWIYNYSIVIVGMMIIAIVLGQITSNITRSEINDANNRFIMQYKAICDLQLREIELQAYELVNSLPAKNILNNKTSTRQQKDDWIKILISDVNTLVSRNNIVSNAYLIFYEEDICIDRDTKYNTQILYESFFKDYYKSSGDCVSDFVIEELRAYKNIKNKNDIGKFLYLTKSIIQKPVAIVVEYNRDVVFDNLQDEGYGKIFLLDANKNFIFSNNQGLDIEVSKIKDSNKEDIKNFENSGYAFGYVNSDVFPGTYLYAIKSTDLYRAVTTTNYILYIGYILCFIISLAVIVYLTVQNYSPIEKLLSKVEMDSRNIRISQNNLKDIILSNLVLGEIPYNQKEFSRLDIDVKGNGIVLVKFEITDYGIYENDDDCYKISSFNISNVFSELVFDFAKTNYCNLDETMICIVSLSENNIDNKIIIDKLNYTHDFLNMNFGLSFAYQVSSTVESLENISKAYLELSSSFNNTEPDNTYDIRCERVKQYIEENFSNGNLSVNDIADYFCLSANYLSKLYKSQTGEGLAHCIVNRRIEEVKKLLGQTDENLNTIAERTGFYSSSALIRTFKKVTGKTPGQFRGN